MSSNSHGITTVGLSDTMKESVGKMIFGEQKLRYFAPYIIGLWVDALLLGALIVVWARWLSTSAASEKRTTKALVYYLLILHVGTTGYTLATQIHLFVEGFGEYKNFLSVDWVKAPFTLNAFSRVPCAAFFTHRAWFMHRKNPLVPLLVGPLLQGYAGCAFAISATWNYLPTPPITQKLIIAMAALSVSFDSTLTILLAVGLVRCKTGWFATDALVTRILRITVETQVPPTIVAVLLMMTVAAWPDGSDIVYFNGAPKIHVICLLTILCSRVDMSKHANSSTGQAYMLIIKAHDTLELGSTAGESSTNFSMKYPPRPGTYVEQVTSISSRDAE